MRPNFVNVIVLSVAILAALVGGPWLARQFSSLPHAAELAARSTQRIVTLEVRGVRGADSEARLERILTAVPGVSEADVRPAQDRAYVVCEHGVADDLLLAAVVRAGPGVTAAVVAR
jgi:hypothetical protein